jgi:uncharacterized protein (TIGR01244 family)
MNHRALIAIAVTAIWLAAPALAQQVTRETVAGVTNFNRLETTVACAGSTSAEAIPEIKRLGFKTIVNLRQASEGGLSPEAEEAAVKAAGLRYYHVPMSAQNPAPSAAAKFLDAITAEGSEPAFIHCSGGGRAAAMWLIKRLAVDHWAVDKAVAEANALGLRSEPMRQFAIEYGQSHKR